jgi:hypothetical protein
VCVCGCGGALCFVGLLDLGQEVLVLGEFVHNHVPLLMEVVELHVGRDNAHDFLLHFHFGSVWGVCV